jgi:hypothetical protein
MRAIAIVACLLGLTACSGRDGDPSAPRSALIGPDGGKLVGPDGVALEVPPKALSAAVEITISKRAEPLQAPASDWVGAVYVMQPDGLEFAIPAVISIPAASFGDGVDASTVFVYLNTEGSPEYEALPTTVDPATGAVTAEVWHFTNVGAARLQRQVTLAELVGSSDAYHCSTAVVSGLSNQLLAELGSSPGLVSILDIPRVRTNGFVHPFVQPAMHALLAAAEQDPDAPVPALMVVNSAARTLAQQYLLKLWISAKHCGTKAADPSASDHLDGTAIDIANYDVWKAAFAKHELEWYGSGDVWHFDAIDPNTVEARMQAVKAFQRVWTRYHPCDALAESGIYDAATAERLARSPAAGFSASDDKAGCAVGSSCLKCAGRYACARDGSTCCNEATVCDPAQTCMTCGGSPSSCRQKGSECCGPNICDPGATCQDDGMTCCDPSTCEMDDVCSACGCIHPTQQCCEAALPGVVLDASELCCAARVECEPGQVLAPVGVDYSTPCCASFDTNNPWPCKAGFTRLLHNPCHIPSYDCVTCGQVVCITDVQLPDHPQCQP